LHRGWWGADSIPFPHEQSHSSRIRRRGVRFQQNSFPPLQSQRLTASLLTCCAPVAPLPFLARTYPPPLSHRLHSTVASLLSLPRTRACPSSSLPLPSLSLLSKSCFPLFIHCPTAWDFFLAVISSFHIKSLPYVPRAPAPHIQLMFKATTLFFQPGSLVADHRDPADRMMVVAMGSLDLFVYPPNQSSLRSEVAAAIWGLGGWVGGCHFAQAIDER
jgi:hypothetical protein